MSRQQISLKEFLQVSGLPDSVVLHLLCEKRLPCSLSADQELLVNLEQLDIDNLFQNIRGQLDQQLQEYEPVVEERFASILADHLDSIFEEACSRYLTEKS